ncbi:hypothetical protein ACOZ4L_02740 [Haloplanus ruber]|uniref:ATP-binding protein n=1 Tax=Haloplanus ruber TaxID=869892 RepID=A0ABD6D201_9EURY|nr:hypothetical protein [Haloplanus ruber]
MSTENTDTCSRTGNEWGAGSRQAHEQYPDPESPPPGWNNLRTDAGEIRMKFSIASWDSSTWEDYEKPYPNCLTHSPPGEAEWGHVGGTNFLAVGEKGSGKSTLGLYWAARLMEVNNEAVVWRGSSSRSEWLPFKHWTKLLLPANAKADSAWKPRDIREQNAGEAADLTEIVREVEYYDDPVDLNDRLEPGKFHVVYPDPSFTGCERIMRESDFSPQPVEFTPQADVEADEEATPVVHWWFAWMVAKLEYGPYDWTSLIFDEAADLAPDDARADQAQTYEKVQALRRVMADSRKFYFSLFFFAHHEQNVHAKIRRTIQWRLSMPDGTANPCQSNGDNAPVGFRQIPMKYDMQSDKNVGHGLMWTETSFSRFMWDDIPVDSVDENRWLKISLAPHSTGARVTETAKAGRGVSDD